MYATSRRVLPGFGLSVSYTVLYLSLLAMIPLAACFAKAFTLEPARFWAAVSTPRAVAAYKFTVGASIASSVISLLLGGLVAWVLVRYEFPFKRLFDSLIDLPFALPTAVAGLVYSSLYVKTGWLGQYLVPLGFHGAYSRTAVVLVLTFLGVPFVVRTLQPVLETLDADTEEAAYLLGASRWQTFCRVIVPTLLPALITGFALSMARGLGEYGSIVFVSGNRPFSTEIASVLIVANLESNHIPEAAAIAVVLLMMSFTLLVLINLLERWSRGHYAD